MIDVAQQNIGTLEKKVGSDAKSPLFAQLAYYYLETSRTQDALRICDAGLANYPFYTTGHLIKGKALIALNMRAEARREFEFVLDYLPNSETIKSLIAQIPPGEEEIIAPAPAIEAQPEIAVQPPAPEYQYTAPPAPQVPQYPEPSSPFGISEPAAPEPEISPFAVPSSGVDYSGFITPTPPAITEDKTFGVGFEAPIEITPVEPEPSPMGGFEFPTSEPAPFSETFPSVPITEQPSGFDFTLPSPGVEYQTPKPPLEEESFETYAARMRMELSGGDTISLENFFANITGSQQQEPSFSQPEINLPQPELDLPLTEPISQDAPDKIEELANKLQSVGKITPVINFAQKETAPASEQDMPVGMGFVTPTLAEIYAKQGWFDDAIKAYRTLARNKPADKDRFEKRIAELEAQKAKQANK